MNRLPADSYTARRLEHATPDHLHHTSKRTFIGPIPDGWLKSHRKQWYKQYLPIGSDSRQNTFIAAQPAVQSPRDERASSSAAVASRAETTQSQQSQTAESNARSVEHENPMQEAAAHGSNSQREEHSTNAQDIQPAPIASQQATPRFSSQSALDNANEHSTTSLLPAPHTSDAEHAEPSRSLNRTSTRPDSEALSSQPSRGMLFDRARNSMPRVQFSEPSRLQIRARAQKLAAKGRLRGSKIKDGEVIKMDKMLVRIDITQQQLPEQFDERVSQGVETKSLDKWREFMVVCRKHSEDDATAVLQLYQTRVIDMSERGKVRKKPKAQILLSARHARVSLFSTLDKTLCVWSTQNSRTTIYYLRATTTSTSVEWFTFLTSILGWKRAQTLTVHVPDLSVSLRLDDPFEALENAQLEAASQDNNSSKSQLDQSLTDESGAAGAIVSRCLAMLKGSPDWQDVLKAWAKTGRVGLAWKRYDRLEWVYGAAEEKMYGSIAMQKTHELELRPKDHYPLSVKPRGETESIDEPLPVEGFLVRLTSQQGQDRRMGKMLFKRLYFSTLDNYLLFLRPARATPPPPPKMHSYGNDNVPTSEQIAKDVPLTFEVNPYPVENGQLSWLKEGDLPPHEIHQQDQDAALEAQRNVDMLLASDGFINLCDVTKVRVMHKGAIPADANVESGDDVDFDLRGNQSREDELADDGATAEVDEDRIFELVMKNGLIVRLQAYNKAARKEWMTRIRALVKYWTKRAKADMDLYKTVREQNLKSLNIDERAEAVVGQFAYKWEVSQSYASPILYNLCGIADCRTIHLSGLLFRKPRRHGTFTRCHVILSHGHLLIYQDTLRKTSGKKLVHIHHERIASIDLQGCYVYSGLLTENDLLYQNRTFDSNTPGHSALPKIYLEDGWTSTDEDAMTTFVIWHSKSKSWFRSSQKMDDVKDTRKKAERVGGGGSKRAKFTRVSQLGTTGRSVVFKARSRAERDHWVLGINNEIERLVARGAGDAEEVRLIEEEGEAEGEEEA
ncbi:hypothetical protein Q7P37_011382 [Cladosporium fusiforme]